ncbi:carbohydrate ABC transporter substrate-binding protein [Pseudoflavonifractor sp. AF19-9AC]|uniref:ABC transporter substrate-binding protein n=1 Tax=Pseudoflavonifractor sp. AF19-9AC TaxID=2292244 RepID=UPI000E504374|nr:ABC transporter substrate-binding protein [Pseudoflavonifractor sp. AF19-9AC]RHR11052.1 carbohydrate ABC transporter substrate-binding protein [Pseudoflavonifractor sp. AF19-9AC]
MKHRTLIFLLAVVLLFCAGCSSATKKEETPTTITVWHVYGGQADSPLNDLIDQFNQTVGKEQQINVQVTSVSNTNTIHELVLSSANGEPGASELPDLFISYPKTVMALPDDSILVDYRDYFSEEELSAFLPAFVEEGTVDNRLVILPVAKSTEIMFINKTIFDRFSQATGVTLEDLDTWEGLFKAAEIYAEWTDSQTPDIPGDAKSMFVHDYYFNYFQVGAESLGEAFFQGDKLTFGPAFQTAWEPLARAAIQGGVWLQGGYATASLRTGDSIVSVASSASILYYSDIVTYPDNTSEDITIISRPCPVFEDGEKLVMQRGAGFCTVRSTPERERAAVTFLKWLTEPEHNVEFVTRTGYMPVTQTAFENELPNAIEGLESPKYASLYQAYLDTQENYKFYVPPQLETYLSLETALEDHVRAQLALGRQDYLEAGEAGLEQISAERLQTFREIMER